MARAQEYGHSIFCAVKRASTYVSSIKLVMTICQKYVACVVLVSVSVAIVVYGVSHAPASCSVHASSSPSASVFRAPALSGASTAD